MVHAEMNPQRLKALSKAMSWILRHEAERLGLMLDPEGYLPLPELISALATHAAIDASEEEIRHVVEDGEGGKQRYSIIGPCIRANYGHSLAAEISHLSASPPDTLFHGTSLDNVAVILREGLRPMQRQYVHLTTDPVLARSVGARHGRPQVLVVDASAAHAAGTEFFRANPRFWLVKALAPDYLLAFINHR